MTFDQKSSARAWNGKSIVESDSALVNRRLTNRPRASRRLEQQGGGVGRLERGRLHRFGRGGWLGVGGVGGVGARRCCSIINNNLLLPRRKAPPASARGGRSIDVERAPPSLSLSLSLSLWLFSKAAHACVCVCVCVCGCVKGRPLLLQSIGQ